MEVVERSKADSLPLLTLSCKFECEWKKTQTVYFMKAIRSIFSAIAKYPELFNDFQFNRNNY